MTNLDAPGYRLREDLRAAAQALIVRRQRTARRRKLAAVAFATAALLAGGGVTAAALLSRATAPAPTTTVSTPAVPSPPVGGSPPANARAQMSVFATAPLPGQRPPEAVEHALAVYASNPGQNFGAVVAAPRLLATSGRIALYASPTSRGYVCYAVWDGSSVAGSCAQNLSPVAPISAVVGQANAGSATVVAGVASDDVAAVTALTTRSSAACEMKVANNGFICETDGATPNTITSFVVRLRDGQVIAVPF